MSSDAFKERQKGFEAKYQVDQELQFRVRNRRNKLFGLWTAARLGMDDGAAQAFAGRVVEVDFDEPGDDDVFAFVTKALSDGGQTVAQAELAAKLEECFAEARTQIMEEGGVM